MAKERIDFYEHGKGHVIRLDGEICGQIVNVDGKPISTVSTSSFLLMSDDDVDQIAIKTKEVSNAYF